MTERVDFYVLKSAAARQRWAFACRLTEKAYLKDLRDRHRQRHAGRCAGAG